MALIQIVRIANPFEPTRRETEEICYTGGKVTAYVEMEGRDVYIDGNLVEHPDETTPLDGSQIVVIPHIAGKGVMKVLGCKLWYIRSMFLAESGAIGLLGGVVGVAISLAISAVLNNLTAIMGLLGGSIDLSGLSSAFGGFGGMGGKISIIPPWLILLALVFATLVGLVSGIAPAGRAVKISSLEAIRHD